MDKKLACRDVEGRPLMEHRAPEQFRQGVPMETRRCPYQGSRYEHERLMNVSALKQMHRYWEEVLQGFVYVRALYFAGAPRQPLMHEVWRIAIMAAALPEYLMLRVHHRTPEEALPVPAAVMTKAAAGLSTPLFELAMSGVTAPGMPWQAVDENLVYDYMDREQLLIGPRQVCAGTESMIKQAVASLAHGGAAVPALDEPPSFLRPLNGDRFLRYSFAKMNLEVLATAFWMADRRIRSDLLQALGGAGPLPDGASLLRTRLISALSRRQHEGRVAPHEQVFARLEPGARGAFLGRMLELFIVPAGAEDRELLQVAGSLLRLWAEPDSRLMAGLRPLLAGAAGSNLEDPFLTKALGEQLARYVELERIYSQLTGRLKRAFASALELPADGGIDDFRREREFIPVSTALREILKEALGMSVEASHDELRLTVRGRELRWSGRAPRAESSVA